MNQRLLWNFELVGHDAAFAEEILAKHYEEALKWEARYFWSADEIIALNLLDVSLANLANYNLKQRDDFYYILPKYDYNIKRRHQELLYKPLLQKTEKACAFASKVNLDTQAVDHEEKTLLQELSQQVSERGIEVHVKKTAFVYKFPTNPKVKLELAKLEVNNKTYFSACIEGKSQILVESIAKLLLGKQISCDYVRFLKSILAL